MRDLKYQSLKEQTHRWLLRNLVADSEPVGRGLGGTQKGHCEEGKEEESARNVHVINLQLIQTQYKPYIN